jgi:hypothetical protein
MATVEQMDPISREALTRRLDAGCQCYTARVSGTVASYGWVSFGPEYVGEFERQLQVREGEAYIWDCATLPDFRRQRLFSAVLAYLTGQLKQGGLERTWIIGLNTAQEITRGVEAAGYRPLMNLIYLRLIDRRVLALDPHRDAPAAQVAYARRLLHQEGERAIGSLLVGNSGRPVPPDTHFDG